jgi:hypothetical protein
VFKVFSIFVCFLFRSLHTYVVRYIYIFYFVLLFSWVSPSVFFDFLYLDVITHGFFQVYYLLVFSQGGKCGILESWIPMDSHGFPWIPMNSMDSLRFLGFPEFPRIPADSRGFHGIPQDSTGLPRIPADSTGFHRIL